MIDVVGFASSILNGFLQLILDFVIFIVNLTLMPIEALISSFIPNYSDLVYHINDYLVTASSYLGFVLDSVGFYSETITLFVAFMLFKLTIPLQIWVVKLAIRWYNAIKT